MSRNRETKDTKDTPMTVASKHRPRIEARLRTMAEQLRTMRLERGLRLADLTAMSGLSEVHLYRLEQGERWPSVPTLLTLAAAYGVDPSVLLGESTTESLTAHDGSAVWVGPEQGGSGVMVRNGAVVRYDLASRMTASEERRAITTTRDEAVGSPEEMIGMALSGCFSMSLAEQLATAGFEPRRVETSAEVRLGVSPVEIAIIGIQLTCEAEVNEIDDRRFQEIAHVTKRSCVVARALAAVPVTLEAVLGQRDNVLSDEDEPSAAPPPQPDDSHNRKET